MKENLQLALNLIATLAILVLAFVLMHGHFGTSVRTSSGADHAAKIAQLEMETDILMGQVMKLQIEARGYRRDFRVHVQTLRALGLIQASPDFEDMGSTDDEESTEGKKP